VTKAQVIRPFVESALKELLGLEQLQVEADGTIPIRRGSTAVFVRLLDEEPPTLHVSSPMLQGVSASFALFERLNEINAGMRFARVFFVEDRVIVATELHAETLDKEEIATAVDVVSGAADHFDDLLRSEFGGEVLYKEEPSETPPEGVPPFPPPPPEGKNDPDGETPPHPEAGYL
jgi:hypothetical protein